MIHRLIIAALLSILAFATLHAADYPDPPKGIRHYELDSTPDFTLRDTDGETFHLQETRGRWVFLHFWASWCGPCRREMPAIQRLSGIIRDDRLAIVLVNTAEDEDTIFSFLGEIGMDTGSLMDADGQVTEAWKPRGLPTTFLVDPQGRVRYQAIGGRDWDDAIYADFLRALLR